MPFKEIADVLIAETGNGGDFILKNNDLSPAYSIENLIPFYLFGGNIEQNTESGNSQNKQNFDWWGNKIEADETYNSNFERQLKKGILTSGGVQDLVNAAKNDLSPLSEKYDIQVSGSIPARGKFKLKIELNGFANKQVIKVYLFKGTEMINTSANALSNTYN